jgi:dTDP-4-dehydrorhamnose 3,5-epimerase
MNVTPLEIEEVLLLEPRVFGDNRGYFLETFAPAKLPEKLRRLSFVQDNLSYSGKGILRGLHVQHPFAQGKLVMVVTGAIFDVAVDVRPDSPSFGRWVGAELSEANHRQLWVPPGFAHGFCVLSDTAHVSYKCTDVYHPETEFSVHYADPDLGIRWPIADPLVSEKDQRGFRLRDVPRERLPTRGAPG